MIWLLEITATILCISGNLILWSLSWKAGLGFMLVTIAICLWKIEEDMGKRK